jgi:Ni,Fe-hydrogenase III large subunit
MVGEDDRAASGSFRLSYLFALPNRDWVTVECAINPERAAFPSVTPAIPAAHWYEREVRDMFGLEPVGHPDPRRLIHHDDWPEGVYPLRKDFDPSVPVPRIAQEQEPFHHLHGDAIIEIPVGPIHAGVIEPGHFRFAAVGEVVLHLQPRLFFTHRGIEKLVEGKPVAQVLQIAERICGACSLSHAVSYSQAIESIAGASIPERASAIRTILLELERLYNHVGDLGNLCAGVGFAAGASFGAKLKDDLQRLNERLSGNRFLRGVCTLGGVRRDLTAGDLDDLRRTLDRVITEFDSFTKILYGSDSTIERFTNTGILPRALAESLGVVGVAARASGLVLDARRDHPYAAYGELQETLATFVPSTEGDVRARAVVRTSEVYISYSLIRALVERLPDGPVAIGLGDLPVGASGFAVTESPRGENLHWVRIGAKGTIDRLRVRSASYPNWPAVPATAPGNMVPDFPLINKSFELCYACLDR